MKSLIHHLFPDRIGPLGYSLRGVVFLVIAFVIGYQFDQLQQRSPEWGQAGPFLWMVMILTLCRAVVIPRLEDACWNRAWILLILVPIINLLFIVKLLGSPSVASYESADDQLK